MIIKSLKKFICFFSLLYFLFVNSTNAQPYVNSFPEIDPVERFTSSILFSGIGNLGFDNLDGYFNPKYAERKNKLLITISGNSTLNSTKNYRANSFSFSESHRLLPNLQLSYLHKDFLFQLHLVNNGLFHQTFKSSEELIIQFNNPSGGAILRFNEIIYSFNNYNFQFDFSYEIKKNLSLSAGLSANYYNQNLELVSNLPPSNRNVKSGNKILEDFHFLTSANYSYKNTKFYLFYKSKIGNADIESEEISIFSQNFIYNSTLEFPGTFAAGLQHKFPDDVNLSLEYNQVISDNKLTKHIFLIPGINFSFKNFMEFGALFAFDISKEPEPTFGYHFDFAHSGKTFFYELSYRYRTNTLGLFLSYRSYHSDRNALFPAPFETNDYSSVSKNFLRFGIDIFL